MIDGHEKSIQGPGCFCEGLDSGRTDGKRSSERLMPKLTATDAAIETRLRRNQKPDEVLPRRRIDVRAVLEAHAVDRYSAFARRAPRDQSRRPAAILLRQMAVVDARHRISS